MTHWALAAIFPLVIAGCSGAFLGHFAVLGVTLSIFLGTLGLNRTRNLHSSDGKVDQTV